MEKFMKQFAQMPEQDLSGYLRPLPDTPLLPSYLRTGHRPIPAPEPDPEPNPAPDEVKRCKPANFLLADWSVLFCALQERLEQCANNDAAEQFNAARGGRFESMNSIVLRCAYDMKLLCPSGL